MLQQLPVCCFSPRNLALAGAKSQSLRWIDVTLPLRLASAPHSRSFPHTPRCMWGVTMQLSSRYIQIMSLSSAISLGSPKHPLTATDCSPARALSMLPLLKGAHCLLRIWPFHFHLLINSDTHCQCNVATAHKL